MGMYQEVRMNPQHQYPHIPAQYSPPATYDAPPQSQDTPSPEETKQELEHAIAGAQEVLCTASTWFPITLFPDTLTLDRAKLTVTHRTFIGIADVMSIRIEDLLNVTATMGPVFGSLRIVSRFFDAEKPYVINWFKRNDALRIKRITQGYVIALQRHIDCSSVPVAQLAAMLEKLGTDAHDTGAK
jgi:hypothetical protein